MKSSGAALAVRAPGMIFDEIIVFVLSALLISLGALPQEALISEWSILSCKVFRHAGLLLGP